MKHLIFLLFLFSCGQKLKSKQIMIGNDTTGNMVFDSTIPHNYGIISVGILRYSVPIIIHYPKKTDSFHLMWHPHSKINIYVEKGCEIIYDSLGHIIIRSTQSKNKTLHIDRVETLNQY